LRRIRTTKEIDIRDIYDVPRTRAIMMVMKAQITTPLTFELGYLRSSTLPSRRLPNNFANSRCRWNKTAKCLTLRFEGDRTVARLIAYCRPGSTRTNLMRNIGGDSDETHQSQSSIATRRIVRPRSRGDPNSGLYSGTKQPSR
jgi:hypothetical protein